MKVIKKTRDATTNYGYTEYDGGNMRRHRKSQSPVFPKNRLNESFSTDTFFAETKALGGDSCAHIFCGTTSYYTWLRGMKTESEGPSALRDFIRPVYAMTIQKCKQVKLLWIYALSILLEPRPPSPTTLTKILPKICRDRQNGCKQSYGP